MTNLWPRTLAEAEEWGLKGIMPPRELRPAPTHDGGRKQYAKCVALMDKGDIEGLELFEVRGEPTDVPGNPKRASLRNGLRGGTSTPQMIQKCILQATKALKHAAEMAEPATAETRLRDVLRSVIELCQAALVETEPLRN